jgi:hypothetical protein
MHIDPNGTVSGQPTLVIRKALRRMRGQLSWGLADLEAAAALNPARDMLCSGATRCATDQSGRAHGLGYHASWTNILVSNGGQTGHAANCGDGVGAVPRACGTG